MASRIELSQSGGGMAELLPRQLFVEKLLHGARVLELGALSIAGARSAISLHDRGAASVISLDRDLVAVAAAQQEAGGPGLGFRGPALADVPVAGFDLVLAHDPSWLGPDPAVLLRVLAPGGRLLLALRGSGRTLAEVAGRRDPAADAYREISTTLGTLFPSVEVVVQRAIAGYALSPIHEATGPLVVEETVTQGEEASYFLFLCGEHASGLRAPKLVLLPLLPLLDQAAQRQTQVEQALRTEVEELKEELSRAERSLEEEVSRKARSPDERDEELSALEEEAARARASARELRDQLADFDGALPADWPGARRGEEGDEASSRRLREAEERAQSAMLHAREAEERMREAERRADAAENARAESALAARRYQAEAEKLRRSAEGIAASIAGRG